MKTAARLIVIAIVMTGIAAALLYAEGVRPSDLNHLNQDRNAVVVSGQTVRIPPVETEPRRLAPVVVASTTGPWKLRDVTKDGTVLHDPCIPIRWKISTDRMPAGAEEVVKEAVADVAAHTGLVWEAEGYVNDPVALERDPLVDEDGWHWAPVLIGWSTEAQTPELADNTAGVGGPMVSRGAYGPHEYLRSGTVILDLDQFPTDLSNATERLRAKALIMHELGHVVGLDHVDDQHQIMYPAALSQLDWGPGDLAGLAAAGAGQCEQP